MVVGETGSSVPVPLLPPSAAKQAQECFWDPVRLLPLGPGPFIPLGPRVSTEDGLSVPLWVRNVLQS